jgi:hypothetical protein
MAAFMVRSVQAAQIAPFTIAIIDIENEANRMSRTSLSSTLQDYGQISLFGSQSKRKLFVVTFDVLSSYCYKLKEKQYFCIMIHLERELLEPTSPSTS